MQSLGLRQVACGMQLSVDWAVVHNLASEGDLDTVWSGWCTARLFDQGARAARTAIGYTSGLRH